MRQWIKIFLFPVTQCHRRQTVDDFWLAEAIAMVLGAGWLLWMHAWRWNRSGTGELLGRPSIITAASVSKASLHQSCCEDVKWGKAGTCGLCFVLHVRRAEEEKRTKTKQKKPTQKSRLTTKEELRAGKKNTFWSQRISEAYSCSCLLEKRLQDYPCSCNAQISW